MNFQRIRELYQSTYPRYLRPAAVALFIAVIPVFLIASNVAWVVNAPFLYSYGFDKYNIPQYTGIEREELISAGKQIRDYFNNGEEFIRIQVRVGGIQVFNLYNEREILHMKDVKALFRGVYAVQLITALYIVAFVVAGFYILRRGFWGRLGLYAAWGGGVTLGLVVFVGLLSLVGFERLFLLFHLISFSNDFWQLDPSKDYLIAMFPQGFFFDATMLIALSIIVEAALLTAVPLTLLKLRRSRDMTRAERRLAARIG